MKTLSARQSKRRNIIDIIASIAFAIIFLFLNKLVGFDIAVAITMVISSIGGTIRVFTAKRMYFSEGNPEYFEKKDNPKLFSKWRGMIIMFYSAVFVVGLYWLIYILSVD